jgi:hypothetical protein
MATGERARWNALQQLNSHPGRRARHSKLFLAPLNWLEKSGAEPFFGTACARERPGN